VRALDGVTLDVPPGTAMGIVGPNGAGKSTLIRILLGYLHASSGSVSLGGMEPRAYVGSRGVAYLPELVAVPPAWTVEHAMRVFASLGEIAEPEERIEASLARVGLEGARDRRVGTLSKGMLQRLGIAQALLGERKVMVLDEPTSGLDPEWTAELRTIVAEWRAADAERVVLIASHDLHELERTADRVAVLVDGSVREVFDLRAPADVFPPYRLEIEAAAHAADAVHAAFPGAVAEEDDPLAFRIAPKDANDLSACLADALRRGVRVRAVAPERTTLEQRFRGSVARARGGREGGR
jgi:ABC-type multidrug transport system ATPase subunit